MSCSPPPPSTIPPTDDPLDIAVSELLGAGNPHAYSTMATIERYLHQFHLVARIDVSEILTEAYLRGKKLQRQGTVIRNPHAWLKRTAYNIVREEKRRYTRHIPVLPEMMDHSSRRPAGDNQWDQLHLESQLAAFWEAFAILMRDDPDGAQLLAWRSLENLSWKQILCQLAAQGEAVPSEAALRQRATRAKKQLRRIYHTC